VGWVTPALLSVVGVSANAGLASAIIAGAVTGSLASGAGQLATNLMSGVNWRSGLGIALIAGFVTGGVAGCIGFKIKEIYLTDQLRSRLSAALSSGEGITVLGKFPKYLQVADDLNANVLDIPSVTWEMIGNKGGRAAQWSVNAEFLDDAIARGDAFFVIISF